ncbi:hypothetical protein ACLOJK_000923 [Asimina triloba]
MLSSLSCLETAFAGFLPIDWIDAPDACFRLGWQFVAPGHRYLEVLAERVSLFDYELIVGDNGKRMIAFGKYAGRAGLIDFLRGLGERYLSLGYSTPFLSLGASYMYSSLAAAKAAVISVGEEIATLGLPSGISPIVFVFTGTGNVSQGAQEIFNLLPHTFVDPSKLPELFKADGDTVHPSRTSRRVFQVYGCVVASQDMVSSKDPSKNFDKVDYYTHPEHYKPVFHERIAPYASVIVNSMYWEKRFPRLLSTEQLRELKRKGSQLIGICDITCDIGGSIEFINQATSLEKPFFRYNPSTDSYHYNMEDDGIICLAVDILPTEFAKEVRSIVYAQDEFLLSSICSEPSPKSGSRSLNGKKYTTLVSLSGHLFDQLLINDALDIIEAAGGSFQLVRCDVGQSTIATSYSELEVGADDRSTLDQIMDSLTTIAHPRDKGQKFDKHTNSLSLKVGRISECNTKNGDDTKGKATVLILGAGRVCRPAVEFLASVGNNSSHQLLKTYMGDVEEPKDVKVIVASLYLKDAEMTIEGIPNAEAIQLDVMDHGSLCNYVAQVDVVISLLPTSCHTQIANACIELKKHLVTASYVSDIMLKLDQEANCAGVTILCEMGLDPGIGNKLYDSAVKFRIPDFPAFALECLPNRNSLEYGDLYGISEEASTIFRGTLRYEGFSEIMGNLAKMGLFNAEVHPMLKEVNRPTFGSFLDELLEIKTTENGGTQRSIREEKEMASRLIKLGHCKEMTSAMKTAKTIRFLGLHEKNEIPATCLSAFDVVCQRMEERLAYASSEQLLLGNKINKRGVVRPLDPEVYLPAELCVLAALDVLEAYGFKILEKMESI